MWCGRRALRHRWMQTTSPPTAYKVPRQIVFVEALPTSTVGKILRRELRDMA